ncbi:hypothetical protein [Kitasatospora acidiphila]
MNDSVPLPGAASGTLSGSLELDPSVDFTYQGGLMPTSMRHPWC